MCRFNAIRWVGNVFLTFGLVCAVLSPNPAGAGEIKAPLDKIIAESGPDAKIAVVAVLKDKVDNDALNKRLKAGKATLAQRHYEVITTLKQKAILTQNPVITSLQNLEAQGEVEEIISFWISNMIAFGGTPKAIKTISALDAIELIEFDMPVESIKPIMGDSEPPLISSRSQGLNVINAPAVWAMGYTGAGRLVSNIDTGVDGTHPALSQRWRGNNGHPASECWFDPVDYSTTPIDHGTGETPHGTHTMGTICGRSYTTYDTVGVAIDAQWIAAASVDYGGTTSDLIASFQFIADPDDDPYTMDDVPDVVGNSWGWSPFWIGYEHCDNTFWSVMDGCENAGVVVIFSAGNEGDDYGANSLRTPADRATTYFNAFSVGAIDGHTAGYPIAYFSSLGPCQCGTGDLNIKPECVAPGVNVYSCVPGGYAGNWSGTSMASPHISGAVAILRQVNPNLDVDEIKSILIQSCVDLGTAGEDNTYGHGYLNLYQAVQLALTNMGAVEGYVRDVVYNSGLPATVSVVGLSTSTTANGSGYYILALPADTTYSIQASYAGYISDTHNVTIIEDDTVSQNFYLDPPIVGYQPISYGVQVAPGESTTRDLLIMNTGLGTLNFSLDPETYSGLMLDNGREIPISISSSLPEPLGYNSTNSDKPEAVDEPYYPPVTLGEGGPDSFGHTWIDSDEPNGPAVGWIDISGSGTTVEPGEDSFVGPISIGFTFPFYTNSYSSLYICSNGMLTFGSGSTDYTNDNIPNASTPNNYIAPFWDDLSPQNGGLVKYRYDSPNNRFIVSYIDVPIYTFSGGTGSLNFQAILYPSGRIDLNYQTMNPGSQNLNSATVGIEASGGTDGLRVVYNAAYIHSSLSIRIDTGGWLSAEPANGSVPAHDTSVATITFNATDLSEGNYTGNINLDNNSPNNPHINIPVTFNVSDVPAPLIELNVSSINDTVYSGYSTVFELLVSNSGDADLTYNLTDNRAWISESPASGIVPAALVDSIDITFDAVSLPPGTYTGIVTVTSNDPHNSSIEIPVSLFVDLLLTDDVGVTDIISPPDSMATGTAYPVRIEIANFGSDQQTFDAVFEVQYDGSPTVIFADTLTIYSMPGNSTNTYIFSRQFDPPINDDYVFAAYTTLSSDQIPANNSISKNSQSFDIVSVWYGNVDGSPVIAPIGENIYVGVTIQTPATAYIADMHLCLGANDLYVDSLLSETENLFYYPLTEWAAAEFTAPQHTPPNPAGWTSQSFIGFARLALLTDAPWLHSEAPLFVMSFVLKIKDNQNLFNEVIPAIGPGLNLYQGPSNAGDSLAESGYQLVEQFSELHFTAPVERTVNVWYGRVDSEPINAVVGANVHVDTYVQTSETGYIGDMHLCLGADNQYIDTLVSESESIFYYPLTEWMAAEFTAAQGTPPNPAGWSSQSFIGFSRLALILDDAPLLHSTTPRRVMSFILKTVDNPGLIGQIQPAIGKGLNLYQGPSNAGDSTGDVGFYLIEHYSMLNFIEAPSGCDYVPGDVNGDGNVIGSDVTYGVNYFRGGPPPPDSCYNESTSQWLYAAGDCNGDCSFIGSDITFLVNFFRGTQPENLWCPDTPPIITPLSENDPADNSGPITK